MYEKRRQIKAEQKNITKQKRKQNDLKTKASKAGKHKQPNL